MYNSGHSIYKQTIGVRKALDQMEAAATFAQAA